MQIQRDTKHTYMQIQRDTKHTYMQIQLYTMYGNCFSYESQPFTPNNAFCSCSGGLYPTNGGTNDRYSRTHGSGFQ